MTTEEAIKTLSADPNSRQLMYDTYVTQSAAEDAETFARSGEFAELLRQIGKPLAGMTIIDLGAGRGIASHAFVKAGAAKVIAIEPDPSDLVGFGAIRQLPTADRIEIITSFGESIPLPDQSADIVYVRQVLHHAHDLEALIAQSYRLCKPGGLFVACREPIVDNEAQLREFLDHHPVHLLAGGEFAYSLERYTSAITKAGFQDVRALKFWDSVINAFPALTSQEELPLHLKSRLRKKLGFLGTIVGASSTGRALFRWCLNRRRTPGRLYSFIARKSA